MQTSNDFVTSIRQSELTCQRIFLNHMLNVFTGHITLITSLQNLGLSRRFNVKNLFIFIVLFLYRPYLVTAQSFNTVQEKYQKGDLKGAEAAAKKALSTKISRQEKAKVLKMLGLVQYTLGNKNAASSSFQQALQIEPDLAIAATEALDPTVLPYFQALKAKNKNPGNSPALQSGSEAANPKPIARTTPLKRTLLKVNSNVSNARVSIDGILAGSANELINVDPGKVEVQLQAPGFPSRKATITIVKDSENSITLHLEKPKAIQKPKIPQQTSLATHKSTPNSRKGKSSSRAEQGGRKSDKQDEDLFAPTPKINGFATGSSAGSGPKRPSVDPAQAFEEEARMGSLPPPMAPGMMPGQSGANMPQMPTQPMIAQPGYGAPQPQAPIYQQQPQAPIYINPPIIYQAPSYSYPPPASLSQPVPPPQDPYTSGQYTPNLPPDPGLKTDGTSQNQISLLTFIPFGIGQFAQERYLMGGVFAAAGVATILLYKNNSDAAAVKIADLQKVKRDYCSPEIVGDDEAVKASCSTAIEERKKLIASDQQNQQLALMGAAGVAIVGVLEAVIWEPPAKTKNPTKRKKSKSRKYRGFTAVDEFESLVTYDHFVKNSQLSLGIKFEIGVQF